MACYEGLSLTHNTTYISTLSFYNGAMEPSVTVAATDGGNIHTYIHTYMHTYMHACTHTHTHTYVHTHIHTLFFMFDFELQFVLTPHLLSLVKLLMVHLSVPTSTSRVASTLSKPVGQVSKTTSQALRNTSSLCITRWGAVYFQRKFTPKPSTEGNEYLPEIGSSLRLEISCLLEW